MRVYPHPARTADVDVRTVPTLLDSGYLPEGIHKTTLKEIETVFGIQSESRIRLFKKAKPGIVNLFQAGANKVWVDGSFTTDKDIPADVDGIWEPGSNIRYDDS